MGHLTIIFGPMFSGKTSELLRKIDIFLSTSKGKCTVVNSGVDIRKNINNENIVSTHSKVIKRMNDDRIIEIKTNNLMDITDIVDDVECFFIDESQFYPDLEQFVLFVLGKEKNIFCFGLISDYKMEKFGHLNDIFYLADIIEQRFSVCLKCRESKNIHECKAPFTSKKVKTEEYIGDSNLYEATCRKHHFF